MWDLPRSGIEPVSPALAGRLLTTEPSGKSHSVAFSALSLGPLPLPPNFALCLNCIVSLLLECAIFPTVLDHLISPTYTVLVTSLPWASLLHSSQAVLSYSWKLCYVPLAPACSLPLPWATSFHPFPGSIHEDHWEEWLPGPALGPLYHPEWR